MVGIQHTERTADKGLGQRLEGARGSKPCEMVIEMIEPWCKTGFRGSSQQRIQAIGTNDQVGPIFDFVDRLQAVIETRYDTDLGGTALQNLQQLQATDRRKANTVQGNALARKLQRHIAPALHQRRDQRVAVRVVRLQKIKRLIGENDAKSKGSISRILLAYPDPG